MVCSKCGKALEEGESVYRAQEGKNIKGAFVFDDPKQQGLYCQSCMVSEDVLPFAKQILNQNMTKGGEINPRPFYSLQKYIQSQDHIDAH